MLSSQERILLTKIIQKKEKVTQKVIINGVTFNDLQKKNVIDWILDNLIDKTRTRRGVMKKLKEMGLVFKNPTKKSLAASSKNLWQYEEDEHLRALYEEHRLDENCLERIIEALGEKRSKNQIIKRMIQLHLIADRSEILPQKPKSRNSKKNRATSDSESQEEDFDFVKGSMQSSNKSEPKRISKLTKKSSTRPIKTRKSVKTPLDIKAVTALISKIDKKYQEALDWVKESLTDAAEDIEEEPSDDHDDGIPLLPLQEVQRDAMEDPQFKKLLISIGIQPPIEEMENYWRIPAYLTAADLQMRVNVISGTHIETEATIQGEDDDDGDKTEEENENEQNNETSDEDDLHENFLSKRRERLNNLVFNKSDNEDEHREPLKPKARKKQKNTKDSNKNSSEKPRKKRGKFNIDEMVKETDGDEVGILDIESENLRQRLAELTDSDSSDKEADTMKSPSHARTRIRLNIIESESSGDEMENTDLLTSKSDRNSITAGQEDPTGESSDQYNNQSPHIRVATGDNATVIVASNEESTTSGGDLQQIGTSKRGRNEDSDDNGSDDDVIPKRKKYNGSVVQRRKLAIIDDDDDDE